MAAQPSYAATPGIVPGQISVANSALDGSGGPTAVVSLLTGVNNGQRITRVTIQAIVSTTAGMIRLFMSDGTNNRLFEEIPVQAVTKSATVPAWSAQSVRAPGVVLPVSAILKASTEKGETFNILVEYGNL